ncbi:MAG: M6 family metalloprotease domain-containing protein [Paludibacteraceae bacterium]|nr:M6 family metalloprotease domain-containing protein [Paludibacteraceae bacterium]
MKGVREIKLTAVCLFFLACTVQSMWSVPARGGWQLKQTTDGSWVRVCQSGDEYYHYWSTEDGKLAEMQADGKFVLTNKPVPTQEQVRVRRAAASSYARAPQAIGKPYLPLRGLVILAGFKDLPYEAGNDSLGMWEMMNKSGYNFNGATGSARDYFIAQSDSQYMPVFDVVGPIVLPKNRAYYGENVSSASTVDKNAKQMIIDACTAVDAYVDFSIYDCDGDGSIDFVYVLFAGIGANDYNGEADAVWPHNDHVGGNNKFDGKKLYNYACSGEIDGGTGDRNGIGTLCHEFGHVMGLPDYYDTNYSTNCNERLTPNDWSVMDVGSYNNCCKTPPNYSLFDKYYMGWLTPKVLDKDSALDVTIGTGYADGYQLTRDGESVPCSQPDTVYYIENRQNTGWDVHTPGHGMLVWQVVYNESAWTNNTPNNAAYKPRYTVKSAANGYIGAQYETPGVCEKVPYSTFNTFPGSSQVTNVTLMPGYAMTEISEVNGDIRFKLNGGSPATKGERLEVKGERRKVLLNGQIYIQNQDKIYTIFGQQTNTFNN